MPFPTLALALALTAPTDAFGCPPYVPTPIGSPDATTVVDAYVDPLDDAALRLYVELRRLVAERSPELRFDLHFIAVPGSTRSGPRRVRVWLAAMAAAGRLEPALRMLAESGVERMAMRLAEPSERARVATAVGLDPTAHEQRWNDRCTAGGIAANQHDVEARFLERGSTIYHPPAFAFDPVLLQDDADLGRLRTELGHLAHRKRRLALQPPQAVPLARPAAPRMRRPPLRGALLGGPGLPHLFVAMARDEEDPNLFMVLPPVLEYRRLHPGVIAVQVVARGPSLSAQRLRRRLCASMQLGLAAHYVSVLATDVQQRLSDPTVQALFEQLDAVPEDGCAGEPDPAELGLPEGGWLDGIPRTRSELENLDVTLRALEAARRPLTPWLVPPATDD